MQKIETEVGFPEAIKDIDGKKITFFKYGLKNNNPDSLPQNLKNKIEKEFKVELEELNYI